MHFKNTRRRSSGGFKLRAMAIMAVIFILLASPFVFSGESNGGIVFRGNTVEAYDFRTSLTGLASKIGLTGSTGAVVSLPVMIGRIVYYALGFIGVIFLILAILAGLKWMFAGGNEETVSKAKSSLINGALGALVALSSYAISYFIVNVIFK